jgi:DNA-binding response OmpR family regulator
VGARAVHVLVVEDDNGIREMLGLALRESGYRVSLSNGSVLRSEDVPDVDVVLLDLRLGQADAREIVAGAPSLASVPVIVITAALDAEREAAGIPSVAGVIRKPFDLDDLEASIRRVVAATRGVSEHQPGNRP